VTGLRDRTTAACKEVARVMARRSQGRPHKNRPAAKTHANTVCSPRLLQQQTHKGKCCLHVGCSRLLSTMQRMRQSEQGAHTATVKGTICTARSEHSPHTSTASLKDATANATEQPWCSELPHSCTECAMASASTAGQVLLLSAPWHQLAQQDKCCCIQSQQQHAQKAPDDP